MLDVTFDYTGQNVATASADGTAKMFGTATQQCIVKMEGHSGEVSKVGVDAMCVEVWCLQAVLAACTTLLKPSRELCL